MPWSRQKPSAVARVRVWAATKRMSSLLPCTDATNERPQRPSPTIAARTMDETSAGGGKVQAREKRARATACSILGVLLASLTGFAFDRWEANIGDAFSQRAA